MTKHAISSDQFGIISPYSTQINQLKSDLKSINLDESVLTIDSMQGREKPIIIFSAVRSNPKNDIGFVSIRNRINVAFTRAQHCLVIVGNAKTLSNGSADWKTMIQQFKRDNIFFLRY
jgi:senataxin